MGVIVFTIIAVIMIVIIIEGGSVSYKEIAGSRITDPTHSEGLYFISWTMHRRQNDISVFVSNYN